VHHLLRHGKRIGTAIIGGLVVLVGIILIPYPGPGWLVVFAGFAILATEFAFAAKVLTILKAKYAAWIVWLQKQPKIIQFAVLGLTSLVVLMTIWLLNTFGIIDTILHLHQTWLHSPLFG
jgi:uncharacterized protein (TIGR02611 family)